MGRNYLTKDSASNEPVIHKRGRVLSTVCGEYFYMISSKNRVTDDWDEATCLACHLARRPEDRDP